MIDPEVAAMEREKRQMDALFYLLDTLRQPTPIKTVFKHFDKSIYRDRCMDHLRRIHQRQ